MHLLWLWRDKIRCGRNYMGGSTVRPLPKVALCQKEKLGWHREGYAAEAAGLLRSTKNTSVESFFLRHTHNICRCVP